MLLEECGSFLLSGLFAGLFAGLFFQLDFFLCLCGGHFGFFGRYGSGGLVSAEVVQDIVTGAVRGNGAVKDIHFGLGGSQVGFTLLLELFQNLVVGLVVLLPAVEEPEAEDGQQRHSQNNGKEDGKDQPCRGVLLRDRGAVFQGIYGFLKVIPGIVQVGQRNAAGGRNLLGFLERVLHGVERGLLIGVLAQALCLGNERREVGTVRFNFADVEAEFLRIVGFNNAVAGFNKFFPAGNVVLAFAGPVIVREAGNGAALALRFADGGLLEDGGVLFVRGQHDRRGAGRQGIGQKLFGRALGLAVHVQGGQQTEGRADFADKALDGVRVLGAAENDNVCRLGLTGQCVDGAGILESVDNVQHHGVIADGQGFGQRQDLALRGLVVGAAAALPQDEVVLQLFQGVVADLAGAAFLRYGVHQHPVNGLVFEEDQLAVLGLPDVNGNDVNANFYTLFYAGFGVLRMNAGNAAAGHAEDPAVRVVEAGNLGVHGAVLGFRFLGCL